MQVRRVVTGHDGKGHSVFVSDEAVEPVRSAALPGCEFTQLWQADGAPSFPCDGSVAALTTFFPPVGGYRFAVVTVPPGSTAPPDPSVDRRAAFAELEEELPGLLAYHERGGTGMHTTPTIDFEVVLAGEITLELDDGASRILRVGDTVVQNGTRHRWVNHTEAPATYAVFICGAQHEHVPHVGR